MLFESFSKLAARFTNVHFPAFLPCILESIYHLTVLEDGIFVLWVDQEVSDDIASHELHLYAMFSADVLTALTQPPGVRHYYVDVHFCGGLFLVLLEQFVGLFDLLLLILSLFWTQFGYFQSCSTD